MQPFGAFVSGFAKDTEPGGIFKITRAGFCWAPFGPDCRSSLRAPKWVSARCRLVVNARDAQAQDEKVDKSDDLADLFLAGRSNREGIETVWRKQSMHARLGLCFDLNPNR